MVPIPALPVALTGHGSYSTLKINLMENTVKLQACPLLRGRLLTEN